MFSNWDEYNGKCTKQTLIVLFGKKNDLIPKQNFSAQCCISFPFSPMFLTFFFLLKSLYDVTLKKIYTVQFFVFKAIFSREVLFYTDCLFWLINYSSFLRDTLKITVFYSFKFYLYFIFWLTVKIQHKYSHFFLICKYKFSSWWTFGV